MIMGMAVDTSTMLVLAAIALAEGLTRVPRGGTVFRRILSEGWRIDESAATGNRLLLVHWWSPWTEAIVVAPPANGVTPPGRSELISRLDATASVRGAARIVGSATLVLLVVGIPAGFGYAGAVGGLLAFGGVLTGQAALAVLSWFGLKLLGADRRVRLRSLPVHLNPFAAPALSSRLLAATFAGATPAGVAQTLLCPDRWAKWFRPQAYDARAGRTLGRDLAGELEAPEQAIADALAQRPAIAGDGLWCPRCAATYHSGATECADCNVLLLTASQTMVPGTRLRAAPSLH